MGFDLAPVLLPGEMMVGLGRLIGFLEKNGRENLLSRNRWPFPRSSYCHPHLVVVCCCFSRSYLLADSEILENICNENEKDAPHIVGE